MKTTSYRAAGVMLLVLAGSAVGVVTFRATHPKTLTAHSIMLERSIDDITTNSNAIVTGVVVQTSAAKEKSFVRDGEDVITTAVVKVDRYLSSKGQEKAEMISVKTLGGSVFGETLNAPDSPSLKRGEKVLLFLEPWTDGSYVIYGRAQGKFAIGEDGGVRSDVDDAIAKKLFENDRPTLEGVEKKVNDILIDKVGEPKNK